MDDTECLSALIGDIYDTALDRAKWVDVLEIAARFVGGPAASVYSKDVAQRSGQVYSQHGLDPAFERLYVDKYVKFDPSTHSQLFATEGDIISTKDFIAYNEFLETRFYKEWARPQRLVDSATAVLQKTPTAIAMFTVFRHERNGLVDDEMRRRLGLLIPHVARAVMIGRLLDVGQSKAAAFTDALDGLRAGVFLLDASGHIVHANAAGRVLLSAGEILCAVGGRILARDAESNKLLQDTVIAPGDGDSAIGIEGVSLPLTTPDGEDYIAHVLPLTSGVRRKTGKAYAAAAALFVSKAGVAIPSPPEVIARRYKLTPTELRVLLAIVEVGGVPDVADALGVSPETVKTHLSHVYEKTGVNRQADLVKLVVGFSSRL